MAYLWRDYNMYLMGSRLAAFCAVGLVSRYRVQCRDMDVVKSGDHDS